MPEIGDFMIYKICLNKVKKIRKKELSAEGRSAWLQGKGAVGDLRVHLRTLK